MTPKEIILNGLNDNEHLKFAILNIAIIKDDSAIAFEYMIIFNFDFKRKREYLDKLLDDDAYYPNKGAKIMGIEFCNNSSVIGQLIVDDIKSYIDAEE